VKEPPLPKPFNPWRTEYISILIFSEFQFLDLNKEMILCKKIKIKIKKNDE